MNEGLIDQFLNEDSDSHSKAVLLAEVDADKHQDRVVEFTFNRFNVRLDFGRARAVVTDDLNSSDEGECIVSINAFRALLSASRVKLIETQGPWLPATVQHREQQLCVMDEFTIDARFAPKIGDYFDVELSAFVDDDESWEAMFAGNPDKKKQIEPLSGWSYRAFGQIVSVCPVFVDCGILSVPGVIHTNDPLVIGEFVAFTISRLDAVLYS